MKILVLGDSLAFPRHTKGQSLEHAWPDLVANRIPGSVLWQRARAANMSSGVLDEARELNFFFGDTVPFDVVVVQVGIVDCCPRPVPASVLRFLRGFTAGVRIAAMIDKHHGFLVRLRARPWIAAPVFAANVAGAVAALRKLAPRLILLAIAPPRHHLLENAPGVEGQVRLYNQVLRRVVEQHPRGTLFVDPYSDSNPDLLVLADGHHLTAKGHASVASALVAALVGIN